MKFSINWISELTGPLGIAGKELGNLITVRTAEVEGLQWVEKPVGDWILEIDNKSLTHRPDLWGHHGMAREVAAILGNQLKDLVDLSLLPELGNLVSVEIEDYALCPRYSALVFENVTVGPSPLWLQHRLEAVGLNPINNIVDVTNYVMAEIAQPMHAFDQETLNGNVIYVRRGRPGEQTTALNQEAYEVDQNTLLIADASGPIAIAGVIGGLNTSVTAKTTRLVLESANFHPGQVRRTAARLKCRTDASMRFEKSQDPHNTLRGLARALKLLCEVSPGIQLKEGLIDNWGPFKNPPEIDLPLDWLQRKLGRSVEADKVRRILESLQFQVDAIPGGFHVKVPSWRATRDIAIKDDLVEEVGRMMGYDAITPTSPLAPATPSPERDKLHQLRVQCAAQGFTEVYNYSFVNEDQVLELGLNPGENIRVLNPIASDQRLLRTTLLCGILKNVRENCRHLDSFKLFEIGSEIRRHTEGKTPAQEDPHLIACVFSRDGEGQDDSATQLQEAKRLAECLLTGARVRAVAALPFEHPFRSYELVWKGKVAGRVSELHPRLVEGRAAILDLNLARIQEAGTPEKKYSPLRRFPTSAFDLSIVVPMRTYGGDIEQMLQGPGRQVEFVRQFVGTPLPTDRKSVTFRVTVGAEDHTLSAEEIQTTREGLIERVRGAGFELRGNTPYGEVSPTSEN